ncbi:formate hydrogenlyase subunit 7 [Escherichia coli]|uniref:Formate hydrogenlyase subunit 7 n=1 Tax=Escherichia coli TaxID=562 RepID=A0A376RDV4_ECOLX|nr:formate hydrogenlyase subunit 7 [Escherichia coli]
MSNLLGPRDANGIPVPMTVDESIASMKASLLKKIKRSAYVYRVDCGGCNGCEIEIFATLSPLFDAERFGIKVVPSPRHADILLFTGAVTRAMRSPALRAWQSAPDPKSVSPTVPAVTVAGSSTISTACGAVRIKSSR